MDVKSFVDIMNVDFYTGVPDSLLSPLCDFLISKYGISKNHIIAANEGNAVALAAGYYLATKRYPMVYMQNSGIGNAINPIVSLLSEKVYAIPCIFVVGWRGEPGKNDEPQHMLQGLITKKLLEDVGLEIFVLTSNLTENEFKDILPKLKETLHQGRSIAIIVQKGGLYFNRKLHYKNCNRLTREEAIEQIVDMAGEDIIVSTTGKASRELFEVRECKGKQHTKDFLTVGSMGHASSIALGIALQRPKEKVWCIDGDGALIMHMGALATIGNQKPSNLVHVVIDNNAHESVGGIPTVTSTLNISQVARGCGYEQVMEITEPNELMHALAKGKEASELTMICIKTTIGSRSNLGRPNIDIQEIKKQFMENFA